MIRIFQVGIALLLCWIAHERADFSIDRISAPLRTALAKPPEGMEEIFSQPYHFLGKGRQSFAFVSEDGKTVVKFFNRRYFEMPWYAPFFPVEKEKRALRKKFYWESYLLAEEFLKEEAGLLYVHMSRGGDLPLLSVIDKASRAFQIDLNEVPFIVQKKGEPLYPYLIHSSRQEAEKAIEAFVKIVAKRISFGLADADHDVEHNFGYLDGKPLHLDPGRLSRPSTLSPDHEWWSATHRLRVWLQKNRPELVSSFDTILSEKNRRASLR